MFEVGTFWRERSRPPAATPQERHLSKKAALRVHQLGKELGVSSKEIISRCQAEEIPGIENHMSQVSIGLAETIRQWFGGEAGGVATAVEPAETSEAAAEGGGEGTAESPKPAARARVARKKVAAPKSQVEVSVEAHTAEPPVVEMPRAEAPSALVETVAEAPPAAASPAAPLAAESASPPPSAIAAAAAPPVMNQPRRPKVVGPVGPQVQPKRVELSGPRVIRIEEPEAVPAPRPMRRPPAVPGAAPVTGRGVRAPGSPAAPGTDREGDRGAKGRAPRRRDAGRTGRAGVADEAGRFEPWREQDLAERERRLQGAGGFFRKHRRDARDAATRGGGVRQPTAREVGGVVAVAEPLTVRQLSEATGVKQAEILKKFVLMGVPLTVNSAIDVERAIEVMMEFGIELQVTESKSAAELIEQRFADREPVDVQPRAPVVTILGHVDHGKTSLLDRIRNTNVASGEAGGITQATSAFQVPVTAGSKDRTITFIDTPGHEAFTAMRARGAKVTDIAVLVVAADDGVMPQTVESINHAKAAGVPVVVALNKIDKADATDSNIQRILGQLAEQGLNPVEWGGQTEVVRTSATRGDGIQDLLDILDYIADLRELKADAGGRAVGTVLEAQMAEGRGPVARILVQEGRLRKGDFVAVGRAFGRVRDIVGDRGERLAEAGPSTPVAISGIDELPDAGDRLYCVESLRDAEDAADERRRLDRERELAAPKVTLDNIFERMKQAQRKELPLVVKADVQGSVETLRVLLGRLGTEEVAVSVKHIAVGGINESDVALAEATGAVVLGFNVTSSARARSLAEAKKIDIRLYEVIYHLTDDVTKAATGLLAPEIRLEVLGHAEVRAVFKISKVGMIAGCYVTDGVVERNAQIRVTRDGIVVEKDRRLEQLKRFKDDAKEVRAGQECGMKIVGYDDIRAGDVLECYRSVEVARGAG
jgi:translation initiation factor IF-2